MWALCDLGSNIQLPASASGGSHQHSESNYTRPLPQKIPSSHTMTVIYEPCGRFLSTTVHTLVSCSYVHKQIRIIMSLYIYIQTENKTTLTKPWTTNIVHLTFSRRRGRTTDLHQNAGIRGCKAYRKSPGTNPGSDHEFLTCTTCFAGLETHSSF